MKFFTKAPKEFEGVFFGPFSPFFFNVVTLSSLSRYIIIKRRKINEIYDSV
jgi:hypothetical protein